MCPSRADGAARHLSPRGAPLYAFCAYARDKYQKEMSAGRARTIRRRGMPTRNGARIAGTTSRRLCRRRGGTRSVWELGNSRRLCQSRHSREQMQLQLLPTPQWAVRPRSGIHRSPAREHARSNRAVRPRDLELVDPTLSFFLNFDLAVCLAAD